MAAISENFSKLCLLITWFHTCNLLGSLMRAVEIPSDYGNPPSLFNVPQLPMTNILSNHDFHAWKKNAFIFMIFLTKHYLQSTKPGPDLEKFMVSVLYTFQVVDFQQELNDLIQLSCFQQ